MTTRIFVATARFDPSDGEKWRDYCRWVQIRGLLEEVSLDSGGTFADFLESA